MESAATGYPMVGSVPMPANFKYADVIQRGRPHHEKWDSFTLKHPPMPAARWAKIFSPFDALDGFDERIAEKEVEYESRTELCEDDQAELDRRLNILRSLTWNSRMARANRVIVRVKYFVPCADKNHFAFQRAAGKYETAAGMVLRVNPESISLQTETGDRSISFSNIREIKSKSGVFDREWEIEMP